MHQCPACSMLLTDRPRAISPAWNMVQCPACTHVYSPHEPVAENQHFEHDGYVAWRARNRSQLKAKAVRHIEFMLSKIPARPGKAFELGCSTGESLHEIAKRGWRAYGVDLSAAAIQVARSSYSELQVMYGTESEVLTKEGQSSFDLIMAFHVVEHIRDLSALMRNLLTLLKADGYLYLALPHWNAWSQRVMGDDWPDFMPEHVHLFTKKSMCEWLHHSGFELVHESTAGSSWQWLGGIKRKVKRLAGKSLSTASGQGPRKMPSALGQQILQIGDVILFPLLKCEALFGAGSELRIIAKRIR